MTIKPIFIRTEFNYDRNQASDESGLACPPGESLTQQQFKEEADINTIVNRFGLTGELPEDLRAPVSGDFTDVVDYQTAMNAIRRAEEGFYDLPAPIRARFHNNPGELLDFVENADNREEALKLGIIKPPPEKTRDMVQAVDELATRLEPVLMPKGLATKAGKGDS